MQVFITVVRTVLTISRAKVRVPPNNGFAHEKQISGTIYLPGAPCECVVTRNKRLLDI